MNSDLAWLQHWYARQCDQDWEHQFGVMIQTLDNPGWQVVINLEGTALIDGQFEARKIERSEQNWLHCWVADRKFQAACGAENLDEALGVFRNWATSITSPVPR